jgi:superfamily I DNA and/or RNA helicase
VIYVLDTTRRMHPNVCRFISEAVYEGRLHSYPACAAHRLVLGAGADPALKVAGENTPLWRNRRVVSKQEIERRFTELARVSALNGLRKLHLIAHQNEILSREPHRPYAP